MIQGDSPQFAFCEVKKCFAEVFSACHRCLALLCWEHFQKNQTCVDHGKTTTLTRNTPSTRKKKHDLEVSSKENSEFKISETKSNNYNKKYAACPKCNGLYKRVKQHLRYCKSSDKNDEISKQLVQDCGRDPNTEQFVTYLSQAKRNIKIMRRIPKGARNVISKNVSSCIEEVVKKNDIHSWEKLTKFAYGVLGLPGDTRETRKVSLTTLIKKNLENYMATETLKKIIDTKIAEYDVRGTIRILTTEEGLAPFDQNSLISLREKHPPLRTDPNFPSFDSKEETLEFDQPTTVNQVEKAIKSFPCGSSGGLDGITPQHLKDLINDKNGEYGTQLLNSLAKLVDIMRRGSVPQEVCCWLYGANLIGFKKKDDGIRPVASGGYLEE
ncbi:hypothetical protein JTB14_027069 [Gonioctena quinquepunctata]|nr:hypothetical protein JTB14_027069 [Gonioctena quinquepunctata]